MENKTKLADEVAKLDDEIRDLEKQMEISDAEISQVIYRVQHLIEHEIETVDVP